MVQLAGCASTWFLGDKRGQIRSTYMGVSKNNGTPKSSILIGFSIINHPFWGTPIFGNIHIYIQLRCINNIKTKHTVTVYKHMFLSFNRLVWWLRFVAYLKHQGNRWCLKFESRTWHILGDRLIPLASLSLVWDFTRGPKGCHEN